MVGRRGEGDRPARAVAAARAARSLQPRRGHAQCHRAGRAPVQRAAALGRRRHELRHLPCRGPRLGRRACQGDGAGRARSAHAVAVERGLCALVRLGRCGRFAVVADDPADPRSARDGERCAPASPACCARTRRWPAATSARSAKSPARDDEKLLVDAAKALAAFQADAGQSAHAVRRLPRCAGGGRPRGRAALSAGGPARPEDLHRTRNCAACHFGPRFTNGEFGDVGIPFFTRPGEVDSGRLDGLATLANSTFNLLGRHNDDASGASACAPGTCSACTAISASSACPACASSAHGPFMHNGHLATLEDVVKHYSEVNPDRLHSDAIPLVRPLALTRGAERRPGRLPAHALGRGAAASQPAAALSVTLDRAPSRPLDRMHQSRLSAQIMSLTLKSVARSEMLARP